jgi:cell division protein FtsI (penicillin-binding protein 3)
MKYNIDGVAEESGLLRPVSKWSGLSLASLSIGQEILVSPMQIVRFYAAIANGGVAVRPKIIKSIIADEEQFPVETESQRIMSADSSAVMLNMLRLTVDNGTGRRAYSNIVNIGGKTGTGQMIDASTHKYSATDYVASFAGVFPVENPQVAMIVIYEAPQSSIYGGTTGAETFRKIAEQMAFYYNLGVETTKVHYAYR